MCQRRFKCAAALFIALVLSAPMKCFAAQEADDKPDGGNAIVSFIKLVSDKVEDVSSMDAFNKSFIKPGNTEEQNAVAMFNATVKFVHHESFVNEYLLGSEMCVHDPIKAFNVYGYSHCCCTAAYMAAMARANKMESRGWSTPGHSLPELFYGNEWHMIDPAFINYFPKADGKIASVEELSANIGEWLAKNPELKDKEKWRQFMRNEGWKKGPEILTRCEFFNKNGSLPENGHGWNSMLSQFGDRQKCRVYENGYTLGYQVNNQLRKGERMTFNWSNKGLHLNKEEGAACASMKEIPGKPGSGMQYSTKWGDLTQGRVGNGLREYVVPLANGAFKSAARLVENIQTGNAPAVLVLDAAKPATIILRMPSSYIYLSGELALKSIVGEGGGIAVLLSDNNGLAWKDVSKITASGDQKIDLKPLVYRRYDYLLKLVLTGKGTGIDALTISHDFQHSQRALPALDKGANKLSLSAGPAEGTITIEGSTVPEKVKGKQLSYKDFNPVVNNLSDTNLAVTGGKGDVTFPIEVPGDLVRLRTSAHYRARDAKEGWDVQVSFDEGKTFKTIDRYAGPVAGYCKSTVFSEIPAGTRKALIRYAGNQVSTTLLFACRIDADYKEPNGGFAPVKATLSWEEKGQARQHVQVAKATEDNFAIDCAEKPVMKALVLELAE
jgi:hypothetical protein